MGLACPQCRRTVPEGLQLCHYCGARVQAPATCTSCGHAISALVTACTYCNAPTKLAPTAPAPVAQVPAAAAPRPTPPPPQRKPAGLPDPEQLRIDLRARIFWGEDQAALRAEFVKQGFPSKEVDAALTSAVAERHAHFRRLGLRDLRTGGTFLGASVLAWGAFLLLVDHVRGLKSGRVVGMLYLAMIGLSVAAAFFLFRGARRVLKGGQGEREACDLEEGHT